MGPGHHCNQTIWLSYIVAEWASSGLRRVDRSAQALISSRLSRHIGANRQLPGTNFVDRLASEVTMKAENQRSSVSTEVAGFQCPIESVFCQTNGPVPYIQVGILLDADDLSKRTSGRTGFFNRSRHFLKPRQHFSRKCWHPPIEIWPVVPTRLCLTSKTPNTRNHR